MPAGPLLTKLLELSGERFSELRMHASPIPLGDDMADLAGHPEVGGLVRRAHAIEVGYCGFYSPRRSILSIYYVIRTEYSVLVFGTYKYSISSSHLGIFTPPFTSPSPRT